MKRVCWQRGEDIIKRMGDGWLVEYANVSDAVACAIETQQGLTEHEFGKLRVRIHVGDITRMDNDVYGDGVNIATRLEPLRLDPKYGVTHQTLGRILFGLRRYKEAETHFMQKLAMAPHSDHTRLFLSALYSHTDRLEEARSMWQELKAINPGFSLAQYQTVIIDKKVHWYIALIEGLHKAGLPN